MKANAAAVEVLQIPFSRGVPWYGPNALPIESLEPIRRQGEGEGNPFLLGCLKRPTVEAGESCVLYLHGFPDQSVDHRCGEESYGAFSSRMARKLSESFDCFCALNFSGSPGSTSGLAFHDKTVSQEVWDVLNTMDYLARDLEVGTAGFHLVGLSTGAIIGSVLRGVSDAMCGAMGLPPVLSISVLAACGATSMHTALGFDFDEEQQKDFDNLASCQKQFWLPRNHPSNPEGAVSVDETAPSDDGSQRWVPHNLKLGKQYRDDFLELPVKHHIANSRIPLLVVHGKADTSVPIEEGRALYEVAAEPKKFVEIPKGNHLLTNSKDLKKAIRAIQEWQAEHKSDNAK